MKLMDVLFGRMIDRKIVEYGSGFSVCSQNRDRTDLEGNEPLCERSGEVHCQK